MNYLDAVIKLLQDVRETQSDVIEKAAQVVADSIQADHLVYIFGAGHAGILAQELFYRAGGLVPISPILPPGLTTDVRPVTLTSRLERLPGFGEQIVAETPIESGDVLTTEAEAERAAKEAAEARVAELEAELDRLRRDRDIQG